MVCPICKEEWTKLRPCKFFWNGRLDVTNYCVKCAETTRSIESIANLYPVNGVKLKVGFIGPRDAWSKFGGKVEREIIWRNHYALIEYGALTIGIMATDFGPMLVKIGEEEPRKVNNIMAAWSIVKSEIEKFTDPHVGTSSEKKEPITESVWWEK